MSFKLEIPKFTEDKIKSWELPKHVTITVFRNLELLEDLPSDRLGKRYVAPVRGVTYCFDVEDDSTGFIYSFVAHIEDKTVRRNKDYCRHLLPEYVIVASAGRTAFLYGDFHA